MANENLGASFSIDITNLKAGLAQANRLIRESESEFRAAAAGMEDWSASEEGLAKRSESLNSQIEIQKAKVDALVRSKEDIIAKMTAEGNSQEEIAAAVDTANKSIEKEGKQLDRLKNELSKNDTALEKFRSGNEKAGKSGQSLKQIVKEQEKTLASLEKEYKKVVNAKNYDANAANELKGKIDKLNSELNKNKEALGKVKDEAKNSGDGFTVMKGAIANLISGGISALISACGNAISSIAGLAESTRDYRRDMSAFAQNAETAGVSLDSMKGKLIEVGAVTGETDAALEGMNMLMATGMDTANIEYAADALAGAATKFSGLKFEGLAEGLQETLATGVAVGPFAELIERTGGDLEAFNEGLASCTTEAERQAYAMQFLSESGLAEANAAYRETNQSIIEAEEAEARFTEAMAELGAIAEPIMTALKNLATDLVKEITPLVALIGEGLSGALAGTEGAADTLAQGIGGLIDTALSKLTDILPFVTEVAVSIFTTLITSLISSLPDLVSTVSEMIVTIINGISAMIPTLVSAVMKALPQLINALIASIPLLLQAGINLFMALVNAVPVIIVELLNALPSIVNTMITALLDSIPILLEAGITLLMAIVDAIPVIIDALITALPQIIESVISGLLEALPLLLEAAITLFFAIIDAIPTIAQELFGAMPEIINAILNSIINALPDMLSTAKQLFDQIATAISDFVSEVPGKMEEVYTSMVNGLLAGLSEFFNVGRDIVKGIWEGIDGNLQWIKNKITGWVGDVTSFLKGLFGIASPSKVMRDEVGKYLAQGIGVGFEENIGDVNRMIENSFDINPKLSRGTSNNGAVGLASGSTAGVTVYQTNNYSQAHSRYELWQSKEQTASAVRLAMIGV